MWQLLGTFLQLESSQLFLQLAWGGLEMGDQVTGPFRICPLL